MQLPGELVCSAKDFLLRYFQAGLCHLALLFGTDEVWWSFGVIEWRWFSVKRPQANDTKVWLGFSFFLLSFSGDLLVLPVFARRKQFCTWWQIKRNLRQDNQTQSRQATWQWFAFLTSPYFTVKNKVSLGLRPLPVQPVPGHFDCSTRQLDGWTILKAINGLGNKCASEYTFHLFLQYLLDKRWLCKQMDRPDVKRKYTNVGKSVDVLARRSDTWPTKQQRWCCRTWCFTMWFTEFSTKGWRNKSREKPTQKNTHTHTIFTPFMQQTSTFLH